MIRNLQVSWSRSCAALLLLLSLAGCAAAPKSPPQPPPLPITPALDPSYDWHGLLLLPFGTVLKDVPYTLHEVLLFRDAAHAAQSDDAECYAIEQTAPRFLARIPGEYLLCFRHDHLARVEATVMLPQDEAAPVFSNACALWQKNDSEAAAAPSVAVDMNACDGRDGTVAYGGRLEEGVDRADRALTIRLDALTQP